MEKILYGDLADEHLIFGDKKYEEIVRSIYYYSGSRGYGYKTLDSKTGIWYYVDLYGARGGGYISAYIGPITDSPRETLLSLKFATIEDFENQRTEWSRETLNDNIQKYEEKRQEFIDSMDDKEVEELDVVK